MTGTTAAGTTAVEATAGTTTLTTATGRTTEDRPVRWRPAFSVRTRITLTVAVLVLLALTATAAMVYLAGLAQVDDDVAAASEQEIAELRRFQESGIDPRTGEPFTDIARLVTVFLERNVPDESELMVGVIDGRFRITSSSSRDGLLDDPVFRDAVLDRVRSGGATTVASAEFGEVHLDVQPLRDQGTGAFVVAQFVDDRRTALSETMRSFLVADALALFLVTGVAWWQSGRLLAPLRTLRRTADQLSESDLSRRIPVAGNDDLTDLTRTFNAMLDRLQQAFAGQRAFLDDAGHELRTPLTVLRGHLELLDPTDPADADRTRDLLLDEVDRMSRLVEDMILLTKADRPGFLTLADVAVDELTDSVLDKARVLGDRRWMVDDRAAVTVRGDEQRLTQALLQLGANAVRHTQPGDVIALGSTVAGSDVQLWVRDTGPGVPEQDRTRIFDRFVRGRHGEQGGGGGLGLSIVAAIAAAHGGTVHVTDAVPHGARFVLTLPLESTVTEDPWRAC